MEATPALLITASLVLFLLSIQPLIWQITHHNIASSFLISWIILLLLFNFVNASIWPATESVTTYLGLGFCDVEVKLIMAASTGTIASATAMLRHLARILDITNTRSLANLSKKEKIIDRTIAYGLCIGLPTLVAALHILVQPSRYMLVPISGCLPTIDRTWLGVVIEHIPIILPGILGVVYATQTLLRLRVYHVQITSILHSSPSATSTSTTTSTRFYRLLALSLLVLMTFPPNIVYLVLSFRNVLKPYQLHTAQGMDTVIVDIHGDYSHHMIGLTTGPQSAGIWALIDRWSVVLLAVVVVGLLGVGKDARGMYAKWIFAVLPCMKGRVGEARRRQWSEGASSWVGSTASSSVFAGWRGSMGRGAKALFGRKESQSVDTLETMGSGRQDVRQYSTSPTAEPRHFEPAHMKTGTSIAEMEELAHPGVRWFREDVGAMV